MVSELLLLRVGADTLRLVTLRLGVAAVLITVACAVLGRVAGGRDSELGEILSAAAVNGNPSLALAVIAASDPTLKTGGVVAAYLLVRAGATILIPFVTKLAPARFRESLVAGCRALRAPVSAWAPRAPRHEVTRQRLGAVRE